MSLLQTRRQVLTTLVALVAAGCGPSGPSASSSGSGAAIDASPPARTGPATAGGIPGLTDTEIVLGSWGPITGPNSSLGLGLRDGLMIAINEANAAGGINGRKISVAFEDDKGDTASSLAAVKKLVESTRVFALAASTGTVTMLASMDYIRTQIGLPTINGTSTGAADQPHAEHIFHLNGAARAYAQYLVKYAVDELKLAKLAILTDSSATGQTFVDNWVPELKNHGLEPAVIERYADGDSDFSSQLLKIQGAQPQGILLGAKLREGPLIMRQAADLRVKSQLICDSGPTSNSTLQIAGAAAEGAYMGYLLPKFTGDPDLEQQEFERKWNAAYPGKPEGRPSYFDQWGYGNGYFIVEALKRAGRNITRDNFMNTLETMPEFHRPAGYAASFTPKRHLQTMYAATLQVRDGKFVATGWTFEGPPPPNTLKA